MSGNERRKLIIERLNELVAPISATTLANEFFVTRQIIVGDIARLRASGHAIRAEHKGYVLDKADGSVIIKKIEVAHSDESVRDEFYAVVDNGGKILDVFIEHPVYGKITATLNISSRYDADVFVQKMNEADSNPISCLTEGKHFHTIAVKDEATFDRIVNRLAELDVLVK